MASSRRVVVLEASHDAQVAGRQCTDAYRRRRAHRKAFGSTRRANKVDAPRARKRRHLLRTVGVRSPAPQAAERSEGGPSNYLRVSLRSAPFPNHTNIVHEEGLEPTHLAVPEPKSARSAATGRERPRRPVIARGVRRVSRPLGPGVDDSWTFSRTSGIASSSGAGGPRLSSAAVRAARR